MTVRQRAAGPLHWGCLPQPYKTQYATRLLLVQENEVGKLSFRACALRSVDKCRANPARRRDHKAKVDLWNDLAGLIRSRKSGFQKSPKACGGETEMIE